jgi:hypothetical protein
MVFGIAFDILETAIATLVAVFALLLIKKYEDEINDAHDAMKGYLDFQMDIADYYHRYYVDIVNPQELVGLCYALNMNLVPPGSSNPFADFDSLSSSAYADAKHTARMMLSGSCNTVFPACDREFEIMAAVSGVDSGEAESQFTARRGDRVLAEKVKTILAAINYSYKNPNSILGFVNSAISIQQNLINMAATGYNGAMGLLGVGLGMLSNTLQQRSREAEQETRSSEES